MEKNTPYYALSQIKELVIQERVGITHVARYGAKSLGFDTVDMLAVVSQLSHADFYKSMTSYQDHHIWQDVYRPHTRAGDVYLKLSIIDDLLIVSFKEL